MNCALGITMELSTVTQKGQVTIPIHLRKLLNISEGDKIEFKKSGDRIILTPKKTSKLMDLHGVLPKPKKALSIDEMQDVIET